MPMSPRLLRPRASGAFTPKTISNLGLWLDATDTSSLTFNGNTVSQWRDLSGNGRHFDQATAAQQPNAVTNTLNGKRTLTFSSGGMESATGKDIGRNVGGITMFAVMKKDTVNDGFIFMASRGGNTSQGRFLFSTSSGAWQVGGRRLDANSFDGASYSATGRLGPAVVSNVYDYANAKAFGYYNGALLATDDPFHTAGNTSDTDSDYVGIGSLQSQVSIVGGYIAECIVYRRALSEAERKRVESYLGRKWGVTIYTPPTYADSDVNAYIQSVELADGVQVLETSVRNAINDFIVGCKADGIWSAIKASCILMGARTLSGALTPLVGSAPTNNNFVSGDYDRKTGLLGNGTNKSLNANRAGNADPQDNNSMSVWVTTVPPTGDATIIGSGTGTQSGTTRIGTGSTPLISFRNRTGGAANYVGSYPTGFLGMSRDSGASFVTRRSGINATDSQASSSPQTGATFVFAGSSANTNTPAAWSAPRLAWYHIGESLDMALLDTRISTLYTAIGAAIP